MEDESSVGLLAVPLYLPRLTPRGCRRPDHISLSVRAHLVLDSRRLLPNIRRLALRGHNFIHCSLIHQDINFSNQTRGPRFVSKDLSQTTQVNQMPLGLATLRHPTHHLFASQLAVFAGRSKNLRREAHAKCTAVALHRKVRTLVRARPHHLLRPRASHSPGAVPFLLLDLSLTDSALRANAFPKVTDLFCRLPLPTLVYRLEAVHLGDLLWFSSLVIGDLRSPTVPVSNRGTLQGSVLSPLLHLHLDMIGLPSFHDQILDAIFVVWVTAGCLRHIETQLQEAATTFEQYVRRGGRTCSPAKSELLVVTKHARGQKDFPSALTSTGLSPAARDKLTVPPIPRHKHPTRHTARRDHRSRYLRREYPVRCSAVRVLFTDVNPANERGEVTAVVDADLITIFAASERTLTNVSLLEEPQCPQCVTAPPYCVWCDFAKMSLPFQTPPSPPGRSG
ncbi:hypothetical protein HPB49_001122 [Dermacentor silvarum]|uniref:Uncharacterized protein n=1 Tax=Dermacentor silvarum TaxID=543639 RepID=A0ACB8DI02_DERSI|nr:hypothetical protein HPB49_001122 [Dermacentor silvarum]